MYPAINIRIKNQNTENRLVSWSNDKELLLGPDVIGGNSLKKRIKNQSWKYREMGEIKFLPRSETIIFNYYEINWLKFIVRQAVNT